MTPEQKAVMASFERMIELSKQLTPAERAALEAWEKTHLGDGVTGSSDWPGWTAVFERLSH
jgi:hypothetical protein